MPIAEGIAAAKSAFDVSKIALDLIRDPKPDKEAVRARLIEMQDLILSAQQALGDAKEEIRELRQANDESQRLRDIEADLEMDLQGRYLVRKSEKQRGLIPYCPTCWGSETKLVPLTLYHHPGAFKCALHNITFASAEHLEVTRRENEAARRRADAQHGGGPYSWME